MSLIFAGITPHPPLLLPSIGKDATEKLIETHRALTKLAEDLYIAKPDVIVVISPHEGKYKDAFVVNAHTTFHADLAEFGDVVTKREWRGAEQIAARISHRAHKEGMMARLVSNEKLKHGIFVPLWYLTAMLPHVKILPIGYSELDPASHVAFGEMLKEIFMQEDKRIAVIASGDLSHCLTKNAPQGLHEDGQKFDEMLISLLQTRNTVGMTKLDPGVVANAKECGYRSVLILLGIMKNMNYSFKQYSYEYPFGVGYLVGNLVLE